ncbi:hypothetical protein Ppa06_67530 [Planomonospora parontospora subsp. parontospora]|uniref:Uncharacterized protein n=2 Tax=Planomonospora parontospora TaxID=58119 RepID=A0AA37BNZ5_9ACTN|nr:hypothetical protein [Planomonospora parontospora]GGK99404.1 hypothetical protein GCM10010126_68730 [Planomonospora parontospora]GII12955.1 hypothetical protein Ppa06_67530 [Planomonospora parontospora subsp. parontospora]
MPEQPDNGLAAMQARREKARQGRTPPPPRNPRRADTSAGPVEAEQAPPPQPAPETAVPAAEPAPEPQSAPAPRADAGQRGPGSRRRRSSGIEAEPREPGRGGTTLRLAQVYIDPDLEAWLRTVRATALLAGADVSASAVARLALRALKDSMTPEELVRLLTSKENQAPRSGPGRPRR